MLKDLKIWSQQNLMDMLNFMEIVILKVLCYKKSMIKYKKDMKFYWKD